MTAWSWTRVDQPGPSGLGPAGGWGSRSAVVDGNRLHLLANAGNGSAVGHFSLEPGAQPARHADVPLRRAAGAVATASGLVVGGAATGTDRPGLCVLVADADPLLLVLDEVDPHPGAPVAAWPSLALDQDGARVWVVWAVGGPSAGVRAATLAADGLTLAGAVGTPGVLGLQAAGAPGGGVDVLCQTGSGTVVRRLTGLGGRVPTWDPPPGNDDEPGPSAAATLSTGAVVWPVAADTVCLWDTGTGRRRLVTLPAAPEGGNARVLSATVVHPGGVDHLVWSTRSSTEAAGEPAADRSWVAEAEHPGDAQELPAGVRQVTTAGPRLVGWPGDGAPLAWLGTR